MKTLEYYQAKYSHQKQKFAFLTTWVDSNVFHPSSELKLEIRKEILFKYDALPLNNKWLLFVGRLQEQKAPVRLLGVLGSFQRIHSDSCLIIIGEGNLRNELEEYAKKLGVQKKVFFLGSVNQNTLASFYRSADVLLLTSNFEGMPICVLESLGVGLPVVSTNVGEVGRIVKSGRSGEIIDPYSSEGFAKAIEKIINSPNIYSKHNCTAEVMEYTPEKVLGTIFARIRLFSDKD
jgi:glycosyltransferase involved in cell wall biosynthesis